MVPDPSSSTRDSLRRTCGATTDACCFNGEQVECQHAVADELYVIANGVAVFCGNFTFIGPPTAMGIEANAASPRTIFGNEQVTISAPAKKLDAFIVSLYDLENRTVGETDSGSAEVYIESVSLLGFQRLAIPGNRAVIASGGSTANLTTTCFPAFAPMISYSGTLRGFTRNGRLSFDNVTMHNAQAGMYSFKIRGSHLARNISYAAEFIVHVLPGRPTRLCIWTEFEGSQISNTNDFQPQPRLLLLDPAGNIFQPLRSDKRLDTSRYSFLAEELESSTMETLNVTMNYEKRRYIARTKVGVGEWTDLPMLPRETSMVTHYLAPVPDYVEVSGIGVLQIQFKELRVKGTYGEQYHFVFRSDYLRSSANSVPLLLKLCSSYEYATEGTDTCSACPSGFDNCIGGSTSTCFSCNGSTAMNVTTGYWRYDEWSTFSYSCPSSSCLGGTELGTCVEGYVHHSPLCATCADGYARDFLGKCVECSDAWVSIVLLSLICIVAVGVVSGFLFVSLKSGNNDESDPSVILILKVFLNFVQVVGMLGEFEINFPGYLLSFFNYVAAVSGGSGISVSPVNCLFPWATYLERLDAQLLMPPVLLLALAVVLYFISHRRAKRLAKKRYRIEVSDAAEDAKAEQISELLANSESRSLKQVFTNASMILIFLMYQLIVTQCIKTFRCQTLLRSVDPNDNIRILVADPKLELRRRLLRKPRFNRPVWIDHLRTDSAPLHNVPGAARLSSTRLDNGQPGVLLPHQGIPFAVLVLGVYHCIPQGSYSSAAVHGP